MTDPKARRQRVQRVIRCEVDSLGLVFAVNAFVNGPLSFKVVTFFLNLGLDIVEIVTIPTYRLDFIS